MADIRTIGKGLFNRALWEPKIRAGKGFAHFTDGGLLCFMMLQQQTQLHVLGFDLSKKLTAVIEEQTKPPSQVELVIPGMFQETGRSEGALMGHAYTGVGAGSLIKGNKTRPDRGCLIYMASVRAMGGTGWGIGLGDTLDGTAVSDTDAGFTGLIPIIDTPVGGPSKTFESNEMFQSASPRSGGVGRTIVASGPDGLLLAVVQPHGFWGRLGGGGFDLLQLNSKLVDAGADEAVGLDGSDSVFVYFRRSFMLELSSSAKNNRNITATGFSFIP